ncbi:hypothetical protein LUW76_33715 [Actinomadura madurae]|uniref:hypothetical protein n=1 Tax=Actinomadura madurae TaxID=1993 RepID=UPI002026814D|nr:hypothetical protein [Actinomadura madurae]URM98892.1 hypothetical protein LUW76_33715 [Actinomadura madurae]URN09583.1 hypothetical protein LUW74_43715 [Actinomadura madurae]
MIVVAGRPLVTPSDPRHISRPIPLPAFAFLGGTIFALVHSVPQWEALPLTITIPIGLATWAAVWWIHRRADDDLAAIMPRIVLAGLLIGAVDAVASAAAMRPGSERLPGLFFLQWVAPLVLTYLSDLTRPQRVMAIAGLVAAALAGIAAMPVRPAPLDLLVNHPWWPTWVFAVQGLRQMVDRDAADQRAWLEALHAEGVREGDRRGRRLVIEMTGEAIEQLHARRRAHGDALPPAISTEVENRLAEARVALSAIPPQ